MLWKFEWLPGPVGVKISPLTVQFMSDKRCAVIDNYSCEDIIILGLQMELYYTVAEPGNAGYLYNIMIDISRTKYL